MNHPVPKRYRLILLDRDGVINQESQHFVKSPDECSIIPGSVGAIVGLQALARVAVCTNQSGVGRGLLSHATLGAIHSKINTGITAGGGAPLDFYYCPHLPEDRCECRKPLPGLLRAAMAAVDAAPAQTLYVGDSQRDMRAAQAAGCDSALVLTGHGRETVGRAAYRPTTVVEDLAGLLGYLDKSSLG